MNNRAQQRMDRSIRDAMDDVQRIADRRHAEQQAYAEDRERHSLSALPRPSRHPPRKPRMVLRLDPETGATVLVPAKLR